MNVSVTLNYHIKDMIFNLIEFPVVLISKFIGIIPSAIFPGKFAFMVSPDDVGKIVVPYQATTHNYVELLINFGLIGTIFIFFFIGIGFNWLKSKKHYTPIYIAVCAQLPFFFFRKENSSSQTLFRSFLFVDFKTNVTPKLLFLKVCIAFLISM